MKLYHHATTVDMHISPTKAKATSALGTDQYIGRMFTANGRTIRRPEARLILPVPHSLACNLAFGSSVIYRYV